MVGCGIEEARYFLFIAVVKVSFFYTFQNNYKLLSAMIRGSACRELVNGIGGDDMCDRFIKRQVTLLRRWFHEGVPNLVEHRPQASYYVRLTTLSPSKALGQKLLFKYTSTHGKNRASESKETSADN